MALNTMSDDEIGVVLPANVAIVHHTSDDTYAIAFGSYNSGWVCSCRGHGTGVGNTPSQAVSGSWFDDGGGPLLRFSTLGEALEHLRETGHIRERH